MLCERLLGIGRAVLPMFLSDPQVGKLREWNIPCLSALLHSAFLHVSTGSCQSLNGNVIWKQSSWSTFQIWKSSALQPNFKKKFGNGLAKPNLVTNQMRKDLNEMLSQIKSSCRLRCSFCWKTLYLSKRDASCFCGLFDRNSLTSAE